MTKKTENTSQQTLYFMNFLGVPYTFHVYETTHTLPLDLPSRLVRLTLINKVEKTF